MNSKQKDVTVFDEEKYDTEDWPPDDAIGCVAWFQGKLDSIPREYQEYATIKLDTGGYPDSPLVRIDISYARPKTASELFEEEQEKVREKVRREAQERRDYERLKSKFEGNKP